MARVHVDLVDGEETQAPVPTDGARQGLGGISTNQRLSLVEDVMAKDISNPHVNAEVEAKLTDLAKAKNGISGAVICTGSGAIKAYDKNVERADTALQDPFYKQLVHIARPIIAGWEAMDLGSPGRTSGIDMTRVLGAIDNVRIQVNGRSFARIDSPKPDVSHYIGIALLDKSMNLFLVCCSFSKQYYDDESFGPEMDLCVNEVRRILSLPPRG